MPITTRIRKNEEGQESITVRSQERSEQLKKRREAAKAAEVAAKAEAAQAIAEEEEAAAEGEAEEVVVGLEAVENPSPIKSLLDRPEGLTPSKVLVGITAVSATYFGLLSVVGLAIERTVLDIFKSVVSDPSFVNILVVLSPVIIGLVISAFYYLIPYGFYKGEDGPSSVNPDEEILREAVRDALVRELSLKEEARPEALRGVDGNGSLLASAPEMWEEGVPETKVGSRAAPKVVEDYVDINALTKLSVLSTPAPGSDDRYVAAVDALPSTLEVEQFAAARGY